MDIAKVLEMCKDYLPVILAFLGAFSVLATKTKNKSDDKIVQFILDLVNFFGMNIGNAKNADDK